MKKTSHQDKAKYGIMTKLIEAMGGANKVLESKELIDQMQSMAEKELTGLMAKILVEPTDTPNWERQIALLIGEAKTHLKYSELFTIKER